ncbi:MAG TPA: hypothetical protein DEB24_01750 [Coriobacteriia bacterium]|nr:hypothetical protein [Coriobacteriia bacterium]
MALQSEDYGLLQRLVDTLYREKTVVARLDVIILAEALDFPADLCEIITLLPPGRYGRQRLCDQMNSAISGHGWGMVYGTVE